MTISAHLCRELRTQAGFATQDDLARYLGVSVRTVSRWETRRSQPPPGLHQLMSRIISDTQTHPQERKAATP